MQMVDPSTMYGKICLVTGATSGIGKMTAVGLAKHGARVVLIGRHKERCDTTVREIKAQTGNQAVDYFVADLSSQQGIRQFAQVYKNRYPSLHVLVNNVGVALFKRQLSVDGIELTFATNHLAPFLLTNLLLDTLKASAPARIINVSSIAHKWVKFNPENVQRMNSIFAYFASKFATILFTYELARRLEGTGVTVNALHPGFVATNLGRSNSLLGQIIFSASNWVTRAVSPEEGAETSIYLATSPEGGAVSGKYFVSKKAVPSSKRTYDESLAKQLWDMSASLTGL